jgi:hypothetical protein
LLRGTRVGAAILDGNETASDLLALARDVLLHEGRGCRSVAAILAPAELQPVRFVEAVTRFRKEYPSLDVTKRCIQRTERFLRAVREPFWSEGGMVLVESDVVSREPCLVRWIRYRNEDEVRDWLRRNEHQLQVVVARSPWKSVIPEAVDHADLGFGQDPPLTWRPDGLDTVAFLRRVSRPEYET